MSIAGQYQLESRENFDAYLSARGVDEAKRKAFPDSKPSLTIEVHGDEVKSVWVGGPKTWTVEFTLGQEYEGERKIKRISKIEGNKLITTEVGESEPSSIQEFTAVGMTQTMMAKGVTAKMVFKRI